MGWYFALLFIVLYLMSLIVIAEMQDECEYWEHEAKKWCAKLGEQKIDNGTWKCEDCPYEDTDRCEVCQTMIRR